MTAFETFEDLTDYLETLFLRGEYQPALETAEANLAEFPEHQPLLHYWRLVFFCRLENYPRALALLQECLDHDLWYSELLLRKSPSFQPLQGQPKFEALVQAHVQRRELEAQQTYPLLTLRPQGRCQAGGKPCPLFIGLHTNAGTMQSSLEFWKIPAAAGWLTAAPQSTQAMWRGSYVWDDREQSEREIRRHFENLRRQYNLDPERIVLAGHSMGGEIAAWLAMQQALPACGFLAIGPGGPTLDNPEEWPALVDQAPANLRAAILIREKDRLILPDKIIQFAELLNQNGIPCQLEVIPGEGHGFDPAYVPAIQRALDWLVD